MYWRGARSPNPSTSIQCGSKSARIPIGETPGLGALLLLFHDCELHPYPINALSRFLRQFDATMAPKTGVLRVVQVRPRLSLFQGCSVQGRDLKFAPCASSSACHPDFSEIFSR